MMTLEPNQLDLFPDVKPTPVPRAEALVMNADALLKWKSQVLEYQQKLMQRYTLGSSDLFSLKNFLVY